MGYRNIENNISLEEFASTETSRAFDLQSQSIWSCSFDTTKTTIAADTFEDGDVTVAEDTVTITGHLLKTGLKGQLTTTGTLPAGLALATDYWIIVVDANTIAFASSAANAIAGTKVTITAAAGGGTHTFTPNGTLDLTITAQGTNQTESIPKETPTGWIDLTSPSALSISATGTTTFNFAPVTFTAFRFIRFKFAIVSGSASVEGYFFSKG